MLMLLMIFLFIMVSIFYFLSYILKENQQKNFSEKLNPFECGFDPEHKMRNAFSLRFFLITVIFLIFDVEISILFPIPLIHNLMPLNWNLLFYFFLLVILMGSLIFEWKQGSLEWQWIFI